MSLNQRRIQITIDPKGNYGIEAKEGFSGASCVEQTRELEIAIGGMVVDEGKTSDYYNPDDNNPVSLNI
ncbi:DUF2997 domain-containing protein [Heyndrickxia sporothermodurans]|uniref:DUF2997 domain-containing protein n=1 Tax=Heyndrickxia sporothermodurans TaxID=46224 RepID=UPI0013FE46DC|nr:DUF2997 domain-containing protein [Heyndrickxia sporothermodurans]